MKYIEIYENFNAFEKWFGNSKVVDSNGKPLRVYHGTSKIFDTFRKSKKIATTGLNRDRHIGFFFTDNKEAADYWAGFSGNPNIIPVYLSLQNPLIVDDYEKKFDTLFKSPKHIIQLEQEAKSNGNDGLIIHNVRDTPTVSSETLYIAFASWQIKSAIGNKGTYNKFDRSITERELKV